MRRPKTDSVADDTRRRPIVAIVGRPNVGKSSLFNRLTRSRRALVGNEPGITRDRLYGQVEWAGRGFELIDTGGILPDDPEIIPEAIFRQVRVALDEAAAILFVVDGRTEIAAPDLQLARLLLKLGKPLLLLVNKVDSERQHDSLGPFYSLGLEEVFPVSAEHGIGVDEALDRLIALLPEAEAAPAATEEMPEELRIAIIGRPNVGKSTLLNRLTGEERAIVSAIPGTTRDAVDAVVSRDGHRYRFIDTAGIRRKGKTKLMAEKLSVVMARQHLESADLVLMMMDAVEGPVALDATIAGYAADATKSCILVVNKWDQARALGLQQAEFEQRVRDTFKFLAYAPVAFISAVSGGGVPRLFPLMERIGAERRKRISTAEMNRFLAHVHFERAPVPASQRVRIYYLSQVAAAPPTFVLFVNKPRPLHFAYRRFLENQIRQAFGFEGTPIVLKTRVSS